MMHGRNNGKKLMAVRIVAHSFEIVSYLPLVVLTSGRSRKYLLQRGPDFLTDGL